MKCYIFFSVFRFLQPSLWGKLEDLKPLVTMETEAGASCQSGSGETHKMKGQQKKQNKGFVPLRRGISAKLVK